jgi:serine/threonine-protein phosphatase CPPED1
MRRLLLGLFLAGALCAQTIVQLTDPQFGMFTSDKAFDHETANFEFAVAAVNRIKPAFVMVTGDLVNKAGDSAQIAEYKRVAAKIDPAIKMYVLPGNHDEGNTVSAESLARYREQFGPSYYTFRLGDVAVFALDSNIMKNEGAVPAEAAKMESWFKAELAKARAGGAKQFLVFQHHPLFLATAGEPDVYDNVPREVRERYLKLLHEYGVRLLLCGHTHRNVTALDGELEVTANSSVGKPSNGGKSGLRVITVTPAGISHKYFDFGDLP